MLHFIKCKRFSSSSYPFITPSGTNLATLVAIPRLWETPATTSTSLYTSSVSSAIPPRVSVLMYTPSSLRELYLFGSVGSLGSCSRHDSACAVSSRTKTQFHRILAAQKYPSCSSHRAWQHHWLAQVAIHLGISCIPFGNALVAPFLWTMSLARSR